MFIFIFRRITAQQALDLIWASQIEDLDEVHYVVIHPPNDGNASDEESGDEEAANPGNLPKRQPLSSSYLLGAVKVKVRKIKNVQSNHQQRN